MAQFFFTYSIRSSRLSEAPRSAAVLIALSNISSNLFASSAEIRDGPDNNTYSTDKYIWIDLFPVSRSTHFNYLKSPVKSASYRPVGKMDCAIGHIDRDKHILTYRFSRRCMFLCSDEYRTKLL
jgi:hypothetical protein